MPDALTDVHYDWAHQFCGVDPRAANQSGDGDAGQPNQSVDPNAGPPNQSVDPNAGQPNQSIDPNAGQPNQSVDPNAGQPAQSVDPAAVATPVLAAGLMPTPLTPGPLGPPPITDPSVLELPKIPEPFPTGPVATPPVVEPPVAEAPEVLETVPEVLEAAPEALEAEEALAGGAAALLPEEAAVPVVGWIAAGVTLIFLGYVAYKAYVVTKDGKPQRPATPEEEQAALANKDKPVPAELPPANPMPTAQDPTTGQPLYTPGDGDYTPMIDPATGQPFQLPGAPNSGETAEAGDKKRDRTKPAPDPSTIDPQTGEPYQGDILHGPPIYDPTTGEFNDPNSATTKQSFKSQQEALENFSKFVKDEQLPLTTGEGKAVTGSSNTTGVLHVPVFDAQGNYVGTIYKNIVEPYTFWTWSRGDH